ncbi:MAG: dihydrolipoamide acetyltransferase family protein [Deltaproteobacteria bacterium]
MPIEITLPRQGWTMEEAAFVEWIKNEGELVKIGDPLFAVETDKAVQEIESMDEGILHILPDGPRKDDMVKVGQVIGYLVQAGEVVSFGKKTKAKHATTTSKPETGKTADFAEVKPSAAESSPTAAPAECKAPVPCTTAPSVTPRAAKRALQEGVDLRTVKGSGAGGRIREQDVTAALGSGSRLTSTPMPINIPTPKNEISVGGLRRIIAERMLKSKTATAPVTLTTQADMNKLVSLRKQFKAVATPEKPAPSYTDFAIKLAGMLLLEHPLLNACWEENRITMSNAVNIGLAVDTEDGLLVPVVRDVPGLTLPELAVRTRDLSSVPGDAGSQLKSLAAVLSQSRISGRWEWTRSLRLSTTPSALYLAWGGYAAYRLSSKDRSSSGKKCGSA